MSAKHFLFSIVDMCAGDYVTGEATALAETLAAAVTAVASRLPAVFGDKRRGLRLFRFRFQNGRTGEFSAILGQGETVLEAWTDACKLTRDSFRPKSDGKLREARGLAVLLPAPADDLHALGRVVKRSIERFESDETYAQEQARLAREAELKRLGESVPNGAAA